MVIQSHPSPSWLGNSEERIETSLRSTWDFAQNVGWDPVSPLEQSDVFYWKIIAARSEEAKVLHPAPPWLAVIFGQTNGGKLQASIDKRLVSVWRKIMWYLLSQDSPLTTGCPLKPLEQLSPVASLSGSLFQRKPDEGWAREDHKDFTSEVDLSSWPF